MTKKFMPSTQLLNKLTTKEDVVALYCELEDRGIKIWLDGGWGVDALLGEQTRPHADTDIVVQQRDLKRLRKFLEERGYTDVQRDDTCAWNFVLGDKNGREVDVHVINFDAVGNGIYGPVEKGEMYPAGSLVGIGKVNGHQVRCVAPEYLVKFHTGYKLRDVDFHDVAVLCKRFGIEYPEEYAKLKK